MELGLAQLVVAYALPVIFAITLHEAAHALVASYLGDQTARAQGRVTANPLRHIDPVGTLLVPALILLFSQGGLIFGWAKPVPVIASNLRAPGRDMGLVAAAGPAANLLMALGWAGLLKLALLFDLAGEFVIRMTYAGVIVNLALAALNLIPLPPLDGGRILTALLPSSLAVPYARLEPYGVFILLALLLTGALGGMIGPFIEVGIDAIGALLSIA